MFAKLSSKLVAYGFVCSYAEYSLSTYWKEDILMGLLVYDADIILASNNVFAGQLPKEYLEQCFCIKDHGQLKYFLRPEGDHGPKRLFLCQQKYALKIVDKCVFLEEN